MTPLDHAIYAALWLSFGAGHSLLAAPAVRGWMAARLGPGERLTYNAIALVHIAVVLGVGLVLADDGGFVLPLELRLVQGGLALVGLVVLAAAMREYDAGRFLGTWQLRHGVATEAADADEGLVTTGLHRYVRHPLYAGAFALLWGLAQSEFGAATALWGSLYLLVGSWFEERKLLRRFGADYRAYRARVPAFVPWKGRVG